MRPRGLFAAAAGSYLANCALGVGAATRVLHTERVRWVHHGVYVLTCTLAGAAASSLWWSRSRAGWLLLPAAVPLALVPRVSARSPRHVVLAVSASPSFLAALVAAQLETNPEDR